MAKSQRPKAPLMTPNIPERRRQNRKPVRVPVKIRPKNEDGAVEQTGLTRDLSSTGIFLYSESAFKPGSKLELVIMLPPGLGFGAGGWTLCQASVVRVEESGDKGKGIGVAATFDRVEMLPELI